jgi:hypothetical protein
MDTHNVVQERAASVDAALPLVGLVVLDALDVCRGVGETEETRWGAGCVGEASAGKGKGVEGGPDDKRGSAGEERKS